MKTFISFFYIISYILCLKEFDDQIHFDNTNWSYDSINQVYYQIGIPYYKNPASLEYNTLGVIVPKNYLDCHKNSAEDLYTCFINKNNSIGKYKNSTVAPLVIPVNTPGYTAQRSPTSYNYEKYSDFIKEGIIYIHAGCRGRNDGESFESGAPWGVTDLKGAIRFIRFNSEYIPGDKNSIFSFGHSGGGAQSCLLGTTGDNDIYKIYLNKMGAAMVNDNGEEISDALKGSQCWCPITNLDTADMAYEWNMGQFSTSGTRSEGTFTKSVSNDLAKEYVPYINSLELKDEKGNKLGLKTSDINSGSYYDYIKSVIETSLNNFLKDTIFPYTPSDISPFPPFNKIRRLEKKFDNPSEYIEYLNEKEKWIIYDKESNTANITNIGAFVRNMKNPSKKVGAFDDFNRGQAENLLFGFNQSNQKCHFDILLGLLLKKNDIIYKDLPGYNSSYKDSYLEDVDLKDSLEFSVEKRVQIYNPMYFISHYYDGYNTSKVADYFRINSGIRQGDTSLCVEANLALALKNFGKNVEFTTVWEQGHVEAERDGSDKYIKNFISWVNKCMNPSEDEDDGDKKDNSPFINFSLIYLFLILVLLF